MAQCGLSFFSEAVWIQTALPLLESGEVQCLEHTLESQSAKRFLPGTLDLLREFSKNGKLTGHSLDFPLLSAGQVSAAEETFQKHYGNFTKEGLAYTQLSAHFGFVQSDRFQTGAPLPMPLTPELEVHFVGQLKKLSSCVDCPAGVENLALTTSHQEAREMGPFMARVLEQVPKSFLLLDLHNLYCASLNHKIDFIELLKSYPLDRVTEIHLSGGSESHAKHPLGAFRRDTHDGRVPTEFFNLLTEALPHLKNLKFAILEQLPQALRNKTAQNGFQTDFKIMKQMVTQNGV